MLSLVPSRLLRAPSVWRGRAPARLLVLGCLSRAFAVNVPNSSKRQLKVRLDKLLTDSGAANSRTQSTGFIRGGRVAVNGFVIKSASSKFDVTTSDVVLDGEPVPKPPPILIAYHKPYGVHSTMSDEMGRPDLLGAVESLPLGWRKALHPVGRLDADTTGLLLFSTDGDVTHKMLHPKYGVSKEYTARCEVTAKAAGGEDGLRQLLMDGVETTLGVHTATLLAYYALEPTERPEGADKERWYALVDVRLSVSEGKHRMVRRMLANCGYPVLDLRRDKFGPVLLADLEEGAFRPVDDDKSLIWLNNLL